MFAAINIGTQSLGIVSLILFVIAVGLVFYFSHKQRKAIKNYAKSKGWQPILDEASLKNYAPPFLQCVNEKESFDLAHKAAVEDHEIIFFEYTRTVSSNSNFQFEGDLRNSNNLEPYRYAVACFHVPQPFEHLLLLPHSKVNNFGLHDGLQKYNLEGDFGQHFDVYAPPNTQISTLSLLTPDVMTLLQDLGNKFTVELKANTVWIISNNQNDLQPKKIEGFLNYAVQLKRKLTSKPFSSEASIISKNPA